MKQLIQTCLLLISSFLTTLGQTAISPTSIEYNFYTKRFTKALPNNVKRNDWIQIKIANVNPYVYKVVIAERDSTVPVGTPSPILTGFFDTDEMVKVAANIAGAVSGGGAGAAGAVGPTLISCNAQQQVMNNKIVQYVRDVNDLKADVLAKLNEYANPTRLKQIHKIDISANPASIWIGKPHVADPTTVDVDFSSLFNRAKALQNAFTGAYASYRMNITDCIVAFPGDKKLKAADDLLKQFEQEQRSVLADFAPKLHEKLNILKDELMNLKAENFSFTSAPMQMTQPIKDIKVTFEPVGTANAGLSSDILNIPLRHAKQPFIGFSTGFFYSGLTGNPYIIRDSTALLVRDKQTSPDSVAHYYRLSSENRGTGEWGVAALVHYGENIGSKETVHWHISAGVGLTLQNKPQPRGLLGGGLAFGLKNKLVLTGGVVFGSVETLSDAYTVDKNRILYAAPSQFTQSKLRANAFVSLSYNFLNL